MVEDHSHEQNSRRIDAAALSALMKNDPARDDLLVLVDENDRELGFASKARAHAEGLLHRAFSVVLYRDGGGRTEVLLTRRAAGKYHSAGLWANSCCSHPRAGEAVLEAAERRVAEELGCSVEGLHEVGSFIYRAEFGNGLVEHEFDHVLLGHFDGTLAPDPAEVSETRWIATDDLSTELAEHPERFSAWAPTALSLAIAF